MSWGLETNLDKFVRGRWLTVRILLTYPDRINSFSKPHLDGGIQDQAFSGILDARARVPKLPPGRYRLSKAFVYSGTGPDTGGGEESAFFEVIK